MALVAYRAQSCPSCGWHEGNDEREWSVQAHTCKGCRLIHEATQRTEGADPIPSYVKPHLRRDDPEQETD